MLVAGIVCAVFITAVIIGAAWPPAPKMRLRCRVCSRPIEPTLSHCGQCGSEQ